MKKKLTRLITLALLALSMTFTSVFAATITVTDKNLNATANPDHIVLTWSNDPKTTQTITWRTSTAVNNGVVTYSESSSHRKSAETVQASISKFNNSYSITDPSKGEMNIYTATLTGLDPGTTYEYKVGDGTSNWSNYNTFTTEAPDDNSFKFLVFGDSQDATATYDTWHTTLTNAYNANKDASFMVEVGDVTDNGQMYQHWNGWFDKSKDIIDKIPFIPVAGNHDYKQQSGTVNGVKYGSYGSEPFYFKSQFKVPGNGPTTPYDLKGSVYSYDYGNVHFTVLDSQWREKFVANDKMTQEEKLSGMKSMMDEELAWVDNDLKNTDKQWKIVIFHKPPYYNDQLRTNSDMKNLQPIFDKYNVDMVFNGHDHGVGRTFPVRYDAANKINVFCQSPKDVTTYSYKGITYNYYGTVYYTAGRSSNNCKGDLAPKVWDAFFFDAHRQPVYNTVEVNNGKLTVKCFEQDGNLLDTYTIDKDKPKNSTPAFANAPNGPYNSPSDPSAQLPRMVLYGQAINFGSAPKKVNDIWYVDFNILYDYTRSDFNNKTNKFDSTKNTWQFDDFFFDNDLIKNKVAQLDNSMFLDSSKSMISINALRKLGFSCEYHPETNTIMIEMAVPD